MPRAWTPNGTFGAGDRIVSIVVDHLTCPHCASSAVVVQALDRDPTVANEWPDCLRCLDCGHRYVDSESSAMDWPFQ